MEWYHDWEDQDWHHRHQSHLLGLYPFHQISVNKTPELAAAATKALEIKGDNPPVGVQAGESTFGLVCIVPTKLIRYTASCSPT